MTTTLAAAAALGAAQITLVSAPNVSLGCYLDIVDGTGTSYALGHGQIALDAGRVPAVAALWRQAFGKASYVLLTDYNVNRIAWTPQLRAYFASNFTRVSGHWSPLELYARK